MAVTGSNKLRQSWWRERKPAKSNWQDSCSAKCSMVTANCVSHFIRSPGQQETTNPGKTLGGRVPTLPYWNALLLLWWGQLGLLSHKLSISTFPPVFLTLGHSSGTNCSPPLHVYNYHFPDSALIFQSLSICWSLLILSFFIILTELEWCLPNQTVSSVSYPTRL